MPEKLNFAVPDKMASFDADFALQGACGMLLSSAHFRCGMQMAHLKLLFCSWANCGKASPSNVKSTCSPAKLPTLTGGKEAATKALKAQSLNACELPEAK